MALRLFHGRDKPGGCRQLVGGLLHQFLAVRQDQRALFTFRPEACGNMGENDRFPGSGRHHAELAAETIGEALGDSGDESGLVGAQDHRSEGTRPGCRRSISVAFFKASALSCWRVFIQIDRLRVGC